MRRTLAAIGTAAVTLGVPAGLVLATGAPASADSSGYTYAVTTLGPTWGPGDLVPLTMTLTTLTGVSFDGTADTQFSIAPDGSCSGGFCTPASAGPHTITGVYSAVNFGGMPVSGTASTTIDVLTPASMVITLPGTDPAAVTAGQTIPVAVERLMADGTPLDDVSYRVRLTLGGAPCLGNACTATSWGKQEITATLDDGTTASTEVFVQPGPAVELQITPHTGASWNSTQPASFTVEAFDAVGNDLGDLTADSSFTIGPDGTCTGNTCTAATSGSHTVTATYKSLIGSVTLDAGSPIPSIAPSLPDATVGTPYSHSVLASGDATDAFLGTSAPLPPGLSLASDGTLSGTPTTAGKYTFFVAASNAYGLENAATTITIAPGTPPAKPKVSIGSTAVLEGNSGRKALHLTVRLSAPSSTPVSVSWHTVKGTALPGRDFVWASGTVTIPAGRLTGQVTVYVIGDRKVEPNENFTVVLTSPKGASLGAARGTVLIKNDD